MNIVKKSLTDTKLQLNITATSEELKDLKAKTVKRLAANVKAPGFRPGKAPLNVSEKLLDPNLLQNEFLQTAVQQLYQQAIVTELLRPLNNPQVDITKFVPYSTLEFLAEIEVLAKVTLGDYTKIKKKLPKITVTEAEITEVVDNLRKRLAEKKSSNKAAKDGDEVLVNFEGKDNNGKAVSGASGKDYPLSLGSKTFIPGFEEGLLGLKKDEKKDLKLSFPKDYHATNLAGTPITFHVTVKEVNELVLPKADDTFAAKVGPFKTIAELTKDIKLQLNEQKLRDAQNKLKDEIVEELVKKSTFALPEVLVNDQMALLEDDFKQNLTYRGITLKEYIEQEKLKDETAWREKEIKPQAERRVSVGIVLSQVADKEKITVSEAEQTQATATYRQQYQQQADQFDTPEMQQEVRSRVLTEKTVDFLLSTALS